MPTKYSLDIPTYAVSEKSLVPVSDYLGHLTPIPPSRMFLINKSLVVYKQNNPDSNTYDASQGDGGASLPGTPTAILERAAELQFTHGTAYAMPFGTKEFRRSVIEDYWGWESDSGIGPANVAGTADGRSATRRRGRARISAATATADADTTTASTSVSVG